MNIDARFEKISKYAEDEGVIIPVRKTANSAGYDFYAAEDVVLEPAMGDEMIDRLVKIVAGRYNSSKDVINAFPFDLNTVASIVKEANAKIPLVPTGIKCQIPDGYYLELSVRSSTPLKHWLILGNGIGVIDGDYYNNPDNEGHIYFQLINMLPFPVKISKGECFGQGILKEYHKTIDDEGNENAREGGFGSTSE